MVKLGHYRAACILERSKAAVGVGQRGTLCAKGMTLRNALVRRARMSYYCLRTTPKPGGRTGNVPTTVCSQCDKPEAKCTCEKFCCFCQSQYNVHLCVDGLYYCPDCREACDVRVVETNDH